ncbi:MAG: acyltransferase family protein [Planctomycetaceae bacterium]
MASAIVRLESSDPLKPHRRVVELDALRALAAINLLAFHFTHVYQVKFGYVTPLGFEWPFGAYGVELFFILSGYVNSMSLLRRQQPADFVAARLIRIVPIFLIAIFANVAILTLPPHAPSGVTWAQWLANLTLMPRIFGYECIDPVMWTLQVEITFYAALVAMFRLGALRRYFIGWGTLLALSLAICPWLDNVASFDQGTAWFALATAVRRLLLLDFVPLFAIGFLLYMIQTRVGSLWNNCAGIVAAAAVFHSIDHGKHNPLATLLIIAVVFAAANGRIAPLRLKPLVFLSAISYPVYLFHNNLGCAIIYHFNHAGVPSILSLAIAVVFAFALGTLVTTRIEQPISRWLRKAWQERGLPRAQHPSLEPVAAAE